MKTFDEVVSDICKTCFHFSVFPRDIPGVGVRWVATSKVVPELVLFCHKSPEECRDSLKNATRSGSSVTSEDDELPRL